MLARTVGAIESLEVTLTRVLCRPNSEDALYGDSFDFRDFDDERVFFLNRMLDVLVNAGPSKC